MGRSVLDVPMSEVQGFLSDFTSKYQYDNMCQVTSVTCNAHAYTAAITVHRPNYIWYQVSHMSLSVTCHCQSHVIVSHMSLSVTCHCQSHVTCQSHVIVSHMSHVSHMSLSVTCHCQSHVIVRYFLATR